MDEYIKKSEAVDVIVKYPYNIAGKTATAIKMIEDLPSADVVPKSEYDAVVSAVDNSTQEFLKLHDAYKKAKSEVAREIFAEIDKNFILISIYGIGFEEFKKKYTEDTK